MNDLSLSDLKKSRNQFLEKKLGISRGEDRISLLPESLLCHILSFLTTGEAVWTSVLSSRWRTLWQWVPRLEVDTFEFPNHKACVDFINKFLNCQIEFYLREFKLITGNHVSRYEPCLSRVIKHKIQHLQVDNKLGFRNIKIPLNQSVCENLTFPNSSFEGKHLCGHYLLHCQQEVPANKRPRTTESDSDSDIALDFSYGVALGFGLSLVVVAFRQQLFSF
ncbi:predicted protein [Arabidopsis lyrata subsp. lyrata]|uniref:Predicted protein n=1 Tax=Arabidopsis lyrata subsp. lyrata TaxID=81972 RepID=D7M143_ARALL|nr:predicted protein [Arabidopsis lyrata subsp. lyrata]